MAEGKPDRKLDLTKTCPPFQDPSEMLACSNKHEEKRFLTADERR
jgi:hypothetical protein